ncbi:MAG: hypothetical protein LBR43_02610 [Spiroplasmataceae bacterium]|nr:hypothetical protein [Spiroplasmataceae bacterium]
MEKPKQIINYPVNRYSCSVIINDLWFTELVISQYYKIKKGRSEINDEIIQELVQKLQYINKDFRRMKNNYYSYEPLYIDHRAYNLVWDYDKEKINKNLLIINCYRERKFDKKKND